MKSSLFFVLLQAMQKMKKSRILACKEILDFFVFYMALAISEKERSLFELEHCA
jgi:hypothetical protein